jgi:hypothetical protein
LRFRIGIIDQKINFPEGTVVIQYKTAFIPHKSIFPDQMKLITLDFQTPVNKRFPDLAPGPTAFELCLTDA